MRSTRGDGGNRAAEHAKARAATLEKFEQVRCIGTKEIVDVHYLVTFFVVLQVEYDRVSRGRAGPAGHECRTRPWTDVECSSAVSRLTDSLSGACRVQGRRRGQNTRNRTPAARCALGLRWVGDRSGTERSSRWARERQLRTGPNSSTGRAPGPVG